MPIQAPSVTMTSPLAQARAPARSRGPSTSRPARRREEPSDLSPRVSPGPAARRDRPRQSAAFIATFTRSRVEPLAPACEPAQMPALPEHPSPHDALFKRVFGDVERGGALLRSILPEDLAAVVDWSSLELRSGETVGAALRGLASDLVFSGSVDGQDVRFYLLLEHQSTPDPRMPLRMADYALRLWHPQGQPVDGRLRLSPIVPVVVYHGARPWRVPLDLGEALGTSPTLSAAM
ncbi:MAG: Rpn family recombination-promoting nuclease/putative transposase, partial [Myxococcota bacterium]|nr:Rpn family recombination-promoting nuclease/putative transposase [Myxococcota bacterium]